MVSRSLVSVVDDDESLVANIVMRLNYSMPGGTYKPGLAFGSTSVRADSGEPAIRDVFEIALSDLVAGARGGAVTAAPTSASWLIAAPPDTAPSRSSTPPWCATPTAAPATA